MTMARLRNNKLTLSHVHLKSPKAMENDLAHVIKDLFYILIGPVMGLFAWMGKRLHNQVEGNTKDINDLKVADAIQQTQLKDIKEDISNIDKKLDRILDTVRK